MHKRTTPQSYLTLGSQFLRLAFGSSRLIVKSGNPYAIISDKPISQSEYSQKVLWSDHGVGTAVLFSFFHGIELTLKGFLVAAGQPPNHHSLTDLLKQFEGMFPGTELGEAIKAALPSDSADSPMGRFLASNGIQIDSWYDALKYPEQKKGGKQFNHFDLKFGGSKTLAFWNEISIFSRDINSKALRLIRQLGYP